MKLVRLDTLKEGDKFIMPIFFEGEHISNMMLTFRGIDKNDKSYCRVSISNQIEYEKSNTLVEKYEEWK